MTPSQLRRLAALVVKPAPCLGCCHEDLRDAREELDQWFPETSVRWSVSEQVARLPGGGSTATAVGGRAQVRARRSPSGCRPRNGRHPNGGEHGPAA